jgi:hypothetical protein
MSWGKFAEEFKFICMTFQVISAVSIHVNKFLDMTSRSLLDDNEYFGKRTNSKSALDERVSFIVS